MYSSTTSQVSIHYLWRWYTITKRALSEYEEGIKHAIVAGNSVSDPLLQTMTLAEISRSFIDQHDEVEKAASIAIIAATEAVIRVDYINRVQKKKKDDLSRKFRTLNMRAKRARLDEDILEIWSMVRPARKQAISDFRGVLKLRHWIAHGRYWVPKLGRTYTPTAVFTIAGEISQMIIDG
jgi:hypothetical protein